MRSKTLTSIVMAIVFGAAAIFANQKPLDRQSSRLAATKPGAPAVATRMILAAAGGEATGMPRADTQPVRPEANGSRQNRTGPTA